MCVFIKLSYKACSSFSFNAVKIILSELKHIDWNVARLTWTTRNCEISSVSGLMTKLSNH